MDTDHSDDKEPPECSQAVPPKTKSPCFRVIRRESLWAAQQEDLCRVMELLSIKENQARTVLIHSRWDLKKLDAVLFEKGASNLLAEAGVSIPEEGRAPNNTPAPETATRECNICAETKPEKSMTKMDCGHCFCNDCWTQHFIVNIRDGKSKKIRCMHAECNSICDESIIRSFVSESLAEKFDQFLLESYIDDNNMVKWCPRIPPCGNAIKVEDKDDSVCEVECPCGWQFCFECLSEPHSPCTCSMRAMWVEQLQDQQKARDWKKVNMKLCPECNMLIEKDGGCSFVRCHCGNLFNWHRAGATGKEHTGSAVANQSSSHGKEENKEKSENWLWEWERDQLYFTHCNRYYNGHMDSLKQEMEPNKSMRWMLSHWTSRKEVEGLMRALQRRLLVARRFLSHSYVLAFFMFTDKLRNEMSNKERESQKKIFEDKQQHLEVQVEKLGNLVQSLQAMLDDSLDSDDKYYSLVCTIIDSSTATDMDSLCIDMYHFIKNDLLGSLQSCSLQIAPYSSEGPLKAT